MSFNPFEQKTTTVEKGLESWQKIFVEPYDKTKTDPFTKLRVILMNGTEFEANWYSHQFSRHCTDQDLRREIATIRRVEQQQQKKISGLKPLGESILETTIGYEQLAVELTANLARREKNEDVKNALNFALLEDFDHLYRFSNLLKMEHGIDASVLVDKRTEITPGRPTISEHRLAPDDVRHHIDAEHSDPFTRLCSAIITAAEQQTMNYYMNVAGFYTSELGRKMFSEIAMIEEQHVTQYGSLMDVKCSWLTGLLEHEYVECYLYWSCVQDETDPRIKTIWETCLEQELAHLQKVACLLEKYEGKSYKDVFPCPDFPEPLTFGTDNIDYVRGVLKKTAWYTSVGEGYADVRDMDCKYSYFVWQGKLNGCGDHTPSHQVIDLYIKNFKEDFRFEVGKNPVKELQDRTCDNTSVGRCSKDCK